MPCAWSGAAALRPVTRALGLWRPGPAGIIGCMDRNPSVGSGELLLEELVRAAQLASPAELPVVLNRYT